MQNRNACSVCGPVSRKLQVCARVHWQVRSCEQLKESHLSSQTQKLPRNRISAENGKPSTVPPRKAFEAPECRQGFLAPFDSFTRLHSPARPVIMLAYQARNIPAKCLPLELVGEIKCIANTALSSQNAQQTVVGAQSKRAECRCALAARSK